MKNWSIHKIKGDKCNPIRLPLDSNLGECISIDDDIIFFDSLLDAKAMLALERDYRNHCNIDFSNGINWEGPGYYYASTDKYDDQNIWYKYYKTYRLFIPDAERMLADFSDILDKVKRTEELMKAGLWND